MVVKSGWDSAASRPFRGAQEVRISTFTLVGPAPPGPPW